MMRKNKKKKNQNKQKRRTISLSFDTLKPFDSIRFNTDSGLSEPLIDGEPVKDAITNVYTLVHYNRPKGPKVIAKIPQIGSDYYMSPWSFVEHFDVIFAIDTNTKTIKGVKHSVGVMSVLKLLHVKRNNQGLVTEVEAAISLFDALMHGTNYSTNAEPIFWATGIYEGIMKLHPGYNSSQTIGVVVDSDLSNIDAWNKRKIPLFKDQYLPPNFHLIYASTDSGSDFVLNKLLKLCDKEANLQLDRIERGQHEPKIITILLELQVLQVPGVSYRFHDYIADDA